MTAFFNQELTYIKPVSMNCRESTALLVVDMQYHDASPDHGFTLALEKVKPGSMRYYIDRLENQVVPNTARLLEHFRRARMPVVYLVLGSAYQDYRDLAPRFRDWLRAFEHDSGIQDIFWEGNPAFAIRKELAPSPTDVVIRKTTFSAFNSSDFGEYLRYSRMTNLVITGVTTNACIESTARDAMMLDFKVVLVEDCSAALSDDEHRSALENVIQQFGDVMTSDEVLARLRHSENARGPRS